MHRTAFLDAAAIAVNLLADPAVADRWSEPSALTGLTVGGLAGHLARQFHQVVEAVEQPASEQEPRDLTSHYAAAAWLGQDIDAPANVAIRGQSDDYAAVGHAQLIERAHLELATLRATLPGLAPDRAVPIWTGWALRLDDLLVTRMMEITVHSDDIAVSVDLPTPTFPPSVVTPVLGLLTALAVERHGQTAVLRALSRRERAPKTISAL
ncbi:maleylpyruvate isomerase N-terminal domain-containing protein [Asanoa sp. NPDC049573]|uniref:maleylpyruvate isomerase N-terminal domain-containing protein n=1 Tax=Asanoa sp. NPDC049573 TaxID=3155396 RepID=UPI00343FC699